MYVNSSWKRTRCNIPPQLIRKSKSSRIESFYEFVVYNLITENSTGGITLSNGVQSRYKCRRCGQIINHWECLFCQEDWKKQGLIKQNKVK